MIILCNSQWCRIIHQTWLTTYNKNMSPMALNHPKNYSASDGSNHHQRAITNHFRRPSVTQLTKCRWWSPPQPPWHNVVFTSTVDDAVYHRPSICWQQLFFSNEIWVLSSSRKFHRCLIVRWKWLLLETLCQSSSFMHIFAPGNLFTLTENVIFIKL